VLLVRAPSTLELNPLPAGAIVHRRRTGGLYDVVLLFVIERHALAELFEKLTRCVGGEWCRVGVLAETGQRSGHRSDRERCS
jgi:hypothetical protein